MTVFQTVTRVFCRLWRQLKNLKLAVGEIREEKISGRVRMQVRCSSRMREKDLNLIQNCSSALVDGLLIPSQSRLAQV